MVVRSEEDSSEDEEDKLYIMEFFIKKMEVIEEVLVSFFFVSFKLDISDMEVCKIIFIGSDYVSDSV